MVKIQQQYWYWTSEINPEVCDRYVKEHFINAPKQDGFVEVTEEEYDVKDSKRKTTVSWVKEGCDIFDTMFHYMVAANASGGWDYSISGIEGVQISEYAKGGHYDWHADLTHPCEQGYQRKLSCSIQLSDPDSYEGGDLVFDLTNGQQITAPREKGSIIVFPAFLKHKVTPVTNGTRYSAVSWMRGPAFK